MCISMLKQPGAIAAILSADWIEAELVPVSVITAKHHWYCSSGWKGGSGMLLVLLWVHLCLAQRGLIRLSQELADHIRRGSRIMNKWGAHLAPGLCIHSQHASAWWFCTLLFIVHINIYFRLWIKWWFIIRKLDWTNNKYDLLVERVFL